MSCIIIKHWQCARHGLSNKQRLSHSRELTIKRRYKTGAYCAELEERHTWIFLIILFSIYSKQTFLAKCICFQATPERKESPILNVPVFKKCLRQALCCLWMKVPGNPARLMCSLKTIRLFSLSFSNPWSLQISLSSSLATSGMISLQTQKPWNPLLFPCRVYIVQIASLLWQYESPSATQTNNDFFLQFLPGKLFNLFPLFHRSVEDGIPLAWVFGL